MSAYAGDYNPIAAQDNIRSGAFSQGLGDILTENNDDRQTNDITAILGEVANMSWLGESQLNITAEQADRAPDADATTPFNIAVESSGVSGQVTWTGHESFNGDALVSTDFILRNIWSMTENYTLTTTNGSFSSEDTRILQGTGEVTFTENGTFESNGVAFADDFTGTFTRSIADNRVYTSNGTWNGKGSLVASWVANQSVVSCLDNETAPMPANETLCIQDASASPMVYLLEGEVEANGRLTSDGISTLITDHSGDSFEATGSFEGTGTLNGTGLFVGPGDFSGPMVQPGSFYITGLLPGVYNMIAQLENGKEVLLPDPVNVEITPSYDLAMTMPGSIFEDTLVDFFNEPYANETIELVDLEFGVEQAALILTDENGNFSYGPMSAGEYYYRVDVDNDGWYELNYTFLVRDDSENFSLLMDVPDLYDISLQLNSEIDDITQEAYTDIAGRVVTFTNKDPMFGPINSTSDENGLVYIELPMGSYMISDENGDEYILFDSVDLDSEDISMNSTYAIGTWVNGTIRVMDKGDGMINHTEWNSQEDNLKFEQSESASGLDISFVANDLTFTTKVATNGTYSIRLPSGNTFHMTTFSITSQMSGGQLIELTGDEELDNGLMYLEPTTAVSGFVYLYDNNSLWDGDVPGYSAQTVVATDTDGLEWRTTISDTGTFIFNLQAGDWDFSVEDEALNSTTLDNYNVVVSEELLTNIIEMFVYPDYLTIELNLFMDAGADGVFANGTAVSPAFTLVPLNNHGQQHNYTADNYSSAGNITVILEPGVYSLQFNVTDADGENASDYILVGSEPFEPVLIGLDAYEEALSFPLRNEYLVTGELTNSSGDAIEKQFLLRNEADDLWLNIESDVNGSFASYVPTGDWVAIVAPFFATNDSTETLRSAFTVGDDLSVRMGLNLSCVEVIEFKFQLQENTTKENMSGIRVTLVSHDGLGNITLSKSDSYGNVSEQLMPGNWSLFLNETTPQRQWTLDTSSTPYPPSLSEDGIINLEKIFAELEVEISGKVFWDLDDDDIPDGTEGVANATVTILGNNTLVDTNVTTNEYGVWSLFVPIEDDYQVTVSKEGFSTEVYNLSNSSAYPVHSDPESHDIEITAGNVSVSGNVTDINDASRLNGSTVTLYPTSGMAGESQTVTPVFANDQLTWSAVIAPGKWIVIVTEADAGANGGGVAVGLLDASISDGATLDLEMSLGGWIDLTTTWTDIGLNEYHAGSVSNGSGLLNESVSVTFAVGSEIEWDMPVGTDGSISILMPSEQIEMDSSFITLQHSMGLEMGYIGGAVTQVAEGRSPVTLSYTRTINSDTSITLVEGSMMNATSVEDSDLEFIAIENDVAYQAIEFDLNISYDGTETVQVFDVLGLVGVSPDEANWKVEFWNGTEYVESYELSLGIGNNSNDTSVESSAVLSVRILAPNQSDAWHLEDPHTLKVRLDTDSTPSSEIAVSVQIPQIYGFKFSDVVTEIGIGTGGSGSFSFMLENTGNGDDLFTIELSDNIPEGWEVTPMTSAINIPKTGSRSQMFTAYSSDDFTSGTKKVTVTVTSEDGIFTDSFNVSITKASIELFIDQGDIVTLSDNVADSAGQLVIPVTNLGFLGSSNVVVSASIVDGKSLGSQTITLNPNATTNVEFDLLAEDSSNTVRFEVRVEVAGDESSQVTQEIGIGGEDKTIDFSIEYYITVESKSTPWFTVAIAILGGLVIYGGIRVSRAKSSSNRF